jgi:FAD/FMN-containing dehydrogenase
MYRPYLLVWVRGEPTIAASGRMRRAALDRDPASMLVSLDSRAQLLLLAEDSQGNPARDRLRGTVESVIDAARTARPGAEIHAVVGDGIPLERLPDVAARLRRLTRRHSLLRMLQTLDPREASAFVNAQLAPLEAYDREHGTNLERVLELALDHDSRNTAARAAFMHRNTFRRQVRKALDLIDVDLADPEERLALHVALKMRTSGSPAARGAQKASSSSSSRIAKTQAVPIPSRIATQPVIRAIGNSRESSAKNMPQRIAQANQQKPR